MPKGLSKIRQINQENAAKKAAYDAGGGGFRFLSLNDGQSALVRFLEQGEDVNFIWVHNLPKQPGESFPKKTSCLDQDDEGVACPACERGIKRSSRVIANLIWYGAPKFLRDASGKMLKDGNDNPIIDPADPIENCVAVWDTGPSNGGTLDHIDTQYNGLTQWLFTIKRQGSGKDDTQYFIDPFEPAAGPRPPTPEDIELAKGKVDPFVVRPKLSYGDMARIYSGGAGGGPAPQPGTAPAGTAPQPTGNAFADAATGPINRGAFS